MNAADNTMTVEQAYRAMLWDEWLGAVDQTLRTGQAG